jgi:wyosine [tRNA(Phe)-imidazoG37] synthetase (radical SAM superfamily)
VNAEPYRYIFGPVRSGRLGLSLGLDLLGRRVCSFGCLYCESGPTEILTVERAPYVPAADILGELARYRRDGGPRPDFLTLGGLGEPCLNTDLAAIVAGAREIYPSVPVAVLTNSSLLPDPAVRAGLALADAVLPSMDSLVPDEFRRLNRPHRSIELDAVRRGLLAFRREFAGRIFLEVLLVAGINDSEENRELMGDYCAELRPDRIDVVTMTRPGPSAKARPVNADDLNLWRNAVQRRADISSPAGPVAGTAAADHPAPVSGPRPDPALPDPREGRGAGEGAPGSDRGHSGGQAQGRILASLRRRPQTAGQLAQGLGLDPALVQEVLAGLVQGGRVRVSGPGAAGPEPFYGLPGREEDEDVFS